MTRPFDPDNGPEDFDDPAHDEIRALLGEARVTEEIPPEVAARLDEVLAGLAPAAASPAAVSPAVASIVIPLRRRWAPRVLVAAAAVVVVGGAAVGVGQVMTGSQSESLDAADSATVQQEKGQEGAGSAEPSPSTTADRSPGAASDAALPELSADDFAVAAGYLADRMDDITQAPEQTAPEAELGLTSLSRLNGLLTQLDEDPATRDTTASACAGPVLDGSTTLRVRYEGRPAALVIGPVRDDARTVSVWTCDGSQRLNSTRVPQTSP